MVDVQCLINDRMLAELEGDADVGRPASL